MAVSAPNVSVAQDGQAKLTRDEALDWLRQMKLIRRFEERAEEAYGQGKIGGFLHLYIGEEAIAVGAIAALQPDDDIVTHYRDHGYVLARGVDPNKVMAELYGKVTGLCKGKGGSMHLADVEKHLWGGYAIVGGHIPLATGMAMGIHYRGEQRVVACFFGEGASNTGEFHQALNMAALWKLPLVIIVENNMYGMGTAVDRASAVSDIYQKACAYNIPAVQIDGNDVVKVYETVSIAAKAARRGGGPQFIEARTYRFRGHSMGDPQRYRDKDEVEERRLQDPITLFQHELVEMKLAGGDDFKRLDDEIEAQVAEAVDFAERSPAPDERELCADVYIFTEDGQLA